MLQLLDAGVARHVTRLMLDNMVRRDPGQPGGVDVSLLNEAVQLVDGAWACMCVPCGLGGGTIESHLLPLLLGRGCCRVLCTCGRRIHYLRCHACCLAHAGRVATEASGNVTLHSVAVIAATGVDFISVGALTHSVAALDISLNIETHNADAASATVL